MRNTHNFDRSNVLDAKSVFIDLDTTGAAIVFGNYKAVLNSIETLPSKGSIGVILVNGNLT